MANKIRIKQVDLEGVISASAQIDLLSASNYISFVTQLDTTLSSDAELSAVSSSISQSIHSINQTLNSGLISGSSQLTSSYDERYVLSGSITQTTWDNIDGKPSGLVSESTDLSSLNSFTSSYFTDSSSFDTRVLTEKGRIDAILSASNANTDTFAEIVSLINSVDLDNDNAFATFYTSSNSRFSSLENSTGSYELKGSGILSGSVSYLDLTNIPSGIVSQSTDLSSLNLFTESLDGRVSSLENATGSYLTSLSGAISSSSQLTSSFDTRYTLSGSVQPLPSGLISGSSQLTSSFDERYTLSGSVVNSNINTGSFATTGSNTFNGNQTITGSLIVSSVAVVNGGITVPTGSTLSLTSGSNIFVDSSGGITGSFSGSVFGIGDVLEFSSSIDTRINNIISVPNGTISGSSQLTSSFDTRYTLSGSVQPLPSNLVSSSAQITAFGFISSSQTIDTGSFLTTSSYQTDSASFDTRINSIITESGSNLTYFIEAYANDTYTLPGTFTEDICRYSVVSATENVPSNWFNTSTHTFTPQKAGYWEIIASYDVYRNSEASLIIKKNNSIVASAGSFNAVAQDISKIVYLNGSTDYINIYNVGGAALQRDQYQARSWFQAKFVGNISGSTELPSGLVSGSSQLTSSFDTRYLNTNGDGVISGSSQLTSSFDTRYEEVGRGIVSGSSQLTSSFDTRYTLSGSVVSGTTPAGTISGSSQLTSSFDIRYVQTGSFNSLTASFNSFTSSAQSVTTGSNSFNGTQTITGSLIITTGSFIASQVTANTASLYLTSGSNIYVQNDGIVEITGSLTVNGTTRFETVGGDEGGEIEFGVPQTNTTLSTRVVTDIWQNRLRIFDGNTNGVFIDLSKAPVGVAGEITWKASGIVNAGTFVTLDNIKATITTSGQRGLSLATVSGTIAINMAGNYAGAGVGNSGTSGTATITTTPSTSLFGWGFTLQGDMANYIITDTTNSRAYRIIIQIGGSFNNNLVSIERLH